MARATKAKTKAPSGKPAATRAGSAEGQKQNFNARVNRTIERGAQILGKAGNRAALPGPTSAPNVTPLDLR